MAHHLLFMGLKFFAFVLSLSSAVCVIIWVIYVSQSNMSMYESWTEWFTSISLLIVAALDVFSSLGSPVQRVLPFLHVLVVILIYSMLSALSMNLFVCNKESVYRIVQEEKNQSPLLVDLLSKCDFLRLGFSGYVLAFISHWVFLVTGLFFQRNFKASFSINSGSHLALQNGIEGHDLGRICMAHGSKCVSCGMTESKHASLSSNHQPLQE